MLTAVRSTEKYSSTSSMVSSMMGILAHCLGLVGERLMEPRKLEKSSEARGGRRKCEGEEGIYVYAWGEGGGGRGEGGGGGGGEHETSFAFIHYLMQLNYLLKCQDQLGMKHQVAVDLLVGR